MQQINFTRYLLRIEGGTIFFIIGEVKETILDFSQRSVRVSQIYLAFILYKYKMTQYNSLNVKFPNLHLNNWEPGIKNNTQVRLKLIKWLWLVIPMMRLVLSTNIQVLIFRKPVANSSAAFIIFSKT